MNTGLQQPQTVLVADDMEYNRDVLAAMLQGAGYKVVVAADGDEALELLATGPVDIALLDVLMPKRNGMSVCRELRSKAETRLLPVLLITGLNSTEDRVQGIECGADDFLTKPIMKEELMARVKSLLRIREFTDEMEHIELVLFNLAIHAEGRDPCMKGHCERVAQDAVALGVRVGLPDDQLAALRRGGLVHDIGTIGIPDQILCKRGPLSDDERILMKTHPEIGEGICRPLRAFGSALPIIRHHHERLDGSGYPDGLKNGAIPIAAQVLSVADIYDALVSDRSYRPAFSSEKALEIMAEEAEFGWRDGNLVSELKAHLREGAFSAASADGKSVSWG